MTVTGCPIAAPMVAVRSRPAGIPARHGLTSRHTHTHSPIEITANVDVTAMKPAGWSSRAICVPRTSHTTASDADDPRVPQTSPRPRHPIQASRDCGGDRQDRQREGAGERTVTHRGVARALRILVVQTKPSTRHRPRRRSGSGASTNVAGSPAPLRIRLLEELGHLGPGHLCLALVVIVVIVGLVGIDDALGFPRDRRVVLDG